MIADARAVAVAFIVVTLLLIGAVSAAAAARMHDDPGPRLQYGGTPIELHYEANGANVTKVYVDGTPCIIVSDGNLYASEKVPTIALSCDWSSR